MAVVIRLRRVGGKNQPYFRLVAADSRSPRDGRFLEILGHYDPLRGQEHALVKPDRILYWMGKGARPSKTVKDILKRLKITPPGGEKNLAKQLLTTEDTENTEIRQL